MAMGLLVWLALSLWARPMALPDEGRYVGVAWEMVQSGNWLVPTLDGMPFFHKPPLFYWLTALSLKLFGFHATSARIAPLLGGWLAMGSVCGLAWRWASPRLSRRLVWVTATTPLLFLASQYANLDMLVAGCITATVALAAHACLLRLEKNERQARHALWAAYAMAALGVLAKGLIGGVLPAASLLLWLAWQRQWRLMLGLFSGVGLVIFLLLAAPWFALMQNEFPDFLHYFFVVQHFQRFAAHGFNNVQPLWFYPAVLLLFCLPWSLVGPWQLLKTWRQPRAAANDSHYHASAPSEPTAPAAPKLVSLMACTTLTVLVFFSLPASKLVGYILPAAAPLSYLLTQSLSGLSDRAFKITTALSGVLCLAVVAVFSVVAPKSMQPLGQVLQQVRAKGEPVFMWHHYYYDLPLYAHLETSARVVDAWSSPNIRDHDNWQRELADASDFAPSEVRNLIETADFHQHLCAAPVAWILASEADAQSDPWLSQLKPVQSHNQTRLIRWELDAANPTLPATALCHSGFKG